MSNLNDAQVELLESEFQSYRRFGMYVAPRKGLGRIPTDCGGADRARPPSNMSATICFKVSRLGSVFITSQEVGRWFGNRAKQEDGVPRATAKTPEQLAMLEESFASDPYPGCA